MYKYSRYIAHVARHPWAVLPEKFLDICDLMRLRAEGGRVSDEEIVARFGAEGPGGEPGMPMSGQGGALAVIPVHGTIAYRADSFAASSGGTSAELIGRCFQQAIADEGVKTILLDFDTPGGSVEGIPELAAMIAKGTAVKPVVAHVNALSASAGYWLASQASEIVCTPSGMVGSIGVYMLSIDETEALAKAGVKINAISAGENKLEGAPWVPMSDETRAHFQGQVDLVYRDFLSAVAKGRGVTAAQVKANFGQGRVFDAKEALARGMIDRIATQGETIARLMSGKRRAVGARAETEMPAIEAEAAPINVVVEMDGKAVGEAVMPAITEAIDPERAALDAQQQAEHEAIVAEHQAIVVALSGD